MKCSHCGGTIFDIDDDGLYYCLMCCHSLDSNGSVVYPKVTKGRKKRSR